MKAPDKIYVAESLIKTPYGNEWSPTPYISRENTEYIRKDALLEWAEAEIELSKKVECVSEKSYEEGRQQVAQNLIDKINAI